MEKLTNKEWAKQILEQLRFLSNKEALIESWIKGTGVYSAGFDEEICVLFDSYNFEDSFLPIVETLAISDEFKSKLKVLIKAINDFESDGKSHEQIIQDPKWEMCMSIMKEVIILFEREQDCFTNAPCY
ncbi:MAG: hypothetical protein H8E32_17580 [Nitrospinae bacterium]|nr:hypothetical protein [Nitrospinota bacterium]